jgi:integrase
MKGHIRQRSKGSWAIVIDVGRDSQTGNRKQQWHTVHGTKKDAERALRELLHSLERGVCIRPQRLTLAEYLHQWLDGYVETNCSTRTLDGYHTIVRCHLIPSLGMVPLAQLQPQHIQQYYAQALSDGRADGKGALSARSVLHIHRVLSQALNYAVRQGLLIRNIAELVDPPRARKPKMKTLAPEEVSQLLGAAKGTPYHPVIYVAVNTGLRQAELLGQQWRDLDLDLASLSVTQVLYKRKGVCQFKEPKSSGSRRRLDLSPSLALFLRQYRVEREAERLLLGKPLGKDDLVFSNVDGTPMDPGTLTHNFARIARKAGLPGTRFHDLRHTFASLMLLAGVHPKIVSEMLGHSSVAFTLDTYSHVIGGLQRAAMRRLDEVLQPGLVENQDVCKMFATDPDKVEQGEKFGLPHS